MLTLSTEWPLSALKWMDKIILFKATACRVPFYWHGLTLIPARMSSYNHYKVWGGIIYPFTNLTNIAPHFIIRVIWLFHMAPPGHRELKEVRWCSLIVMCSKYVPSTCPSMNHISYRNTFEMSAFNYNKLWFRAASLVLRYDSIHCMNISLFMDVLTWSLQMSFSRVTICFHNHKTDLRSKPTIGVCLCRSSSMYLRMVFLF